MHQSADTAALILRMTSRPRLLEPCQRQSWVQGGQDGALRKRGGALNRPARRARCGFGRSHVRRRPLGLGRRSRSDQDRRDRGGASGRGFFDSASGADRRRRDQRQGRRRRAKDRDRLLRQPFLIGRVGARVSARRQRGSRQCGDRQLHQRGGPGARTVGRTPQDRLHHARRGVRRHHAKHRQGLRAQQIHVSWLLDVGRAGGAHVRRRQGHAGRRPQDEDGRDHERGRGLDGTARRRLRGLPAEDRAESARPHPLLARHHRLHPDLQ